MPKTSDQNFKVFHDEVSSEDAMQADRHWRKHNRNARNTRYARVLIISVLIMAVIVALLLSQLQKHQTKHNVIQYDNETWQIVSQMPHLVFLVAKEGGGREARDMFTLGMAHGKLVAWLEGNVQKNWRVLLVPNQQSGVNVLGVTSAYYLSQGQLTVVAKDANYNKLTQANIEVMKKLHPGRHFQVSVVESEPSNEHYDLVLIERNNYHERLNQEISKRIVVVRQESQQNTIVSNFEAYDSYQIIKGQTDESIREEHRSIGYATVSYIAPESAQDTVLYFKDKTVKEYPPVLCPSKNNNPVVEFLRNHTVPGDKVYSAIYEGSFVEDLKNSVPQSQLHIASDQQESENWGKIVDQLQQNLSGQKEQQITHNYNIFVVVLAGFPLPTRTPFTTLLILIQNTTELTSHPPNSFFLSSQSNLACFLPPSIRSSPPQSFPFFYILFPSTE